MERNYEVLESEKEVDDSPEQEENIFENDEDEIIFVEDDQHDV